MNDYFSINTTITVTEENSIAIKNLIKSLEAVNAIDEITTQNIIVSAECLDMLSK